MSTFLNPNAIKDGSISASKIDSSIASTEYVDNAIANTNASSLISITWSSLKSLRDTSKLIPGMQYRITNYTCTTALSGTKSAGHQFDIIVVADDESTLNETARAIKHPVAEGETDYFADNNLSAWQIWYCLDNDTSKFAWADAENGKGVIYRMIDEFNNDVPYDFKNIQFYRRWDSSKSLWSTISTDNTGVPCYTFSSVGNGSNPEFTDYSLMTSTNVYSNVIKDLIMSNKQTLNNNCFFGSCFYNTFKENCRNNTFGNNCRSNIFGNRCSHNTFGNGAYDNTFGNDCQTNIFAVDCFENTFGNYCQNNVFENYCNRNTFGNYCQGNTLGGSCSNNTFGNGCHSNSFGVGCAVNTFGSYCSKNTFGDDCDYNSFGNGLYSNSFGRACDYNSFGNGCASNSFGNNCYSNSFGNECVYINFASDKDATTKYSFYQNNHFGDGCEYIILKGAETASAESQVQNYNFAQGLQGTSSTYITVDGKRGRASETKVAKNSSGTLKIYCEADSIK